MINLKNLFFKKRKKRPLKGIDKAELDREMSENIPYGINSEKRNPQLIVSLTSFPDRMNDIHYCIYSLLNQTLKPDMLILWLAEEQYPEKEKNLPQTLLNLTEYGLTIKWCKNLYSYKKLIPTIQEYPDAVIITTDDDVFYEKDCIEKLYNSYQQTPECIICHRGHRISWNPFTQKPLRYKTWKKAIDGESISFKNFQTGAGGVLYPPNCFYKDITNIELFTELAPNADDIWFWAMSVLNNRKIKIPKNNITELTYVNPDRDRGLSGGLTLFSLNKKGGNDMQMEKVLNHYPQIKKIVK